MSSTKVKTTYAVQGAYGSTEYIELYYPYTGEWGRSDFKSCVEFYINEPWNK